MSMLIENQDLIKWRTSHKNIYKKIVSNQTCLFIHVMIQNYRKNKFMHVRFFIISLHHFEAC